VNVARGIRTRDNRYSVYVTVGGKTRTRNFPLDTSLETMEAWRKHTQMTYGSSKVAPFRRALPRSEDGWCYLYFIQQGNAVKIGRTNDVRQRMYKLQTASAMPLTLLVAVAAHATLEIEYLKRMEPFRLNGEWFIYGKEIARVVQLLQAGMNPVELLFSWSKVLAPEDPTP
jgi:hypothetical protein